MTLADELERIKALYDDGYLSYEEYVRAKAIALSEERRPLAPQRSSDSLGSILRRMQRSRRDSAIAGVCGGIAKASNTPSWFWRFIFTFFSFIGGLAIIAYVCLWALIPLEPQSTRK